MSALFSDPRVAAALARLPDYLSQHILVSATALALGLMISLPLALLATRRPALRWALLTAASVVQTIPGLALLALFYPLLLGLSGLTGRLFGAEFSALGFLPSVLALALYSVLPILRNTVTGILGIDPALQQAARGVGMTPRQSLFMVELPLAMPVIMAGIRTSAVWVIGTATLSTPVGQTSLGNYIFTGLQTQNWVFVLFGCVAAAVLALVVDQLLALMERGVATRKRARVIVPGLALVVLMLAAFLPGYGAFARKLRHRRQAIRRAIYPGGIDRAAPDRRRAFGDGPRGARLEHHLQRARRRRHRRLCRLFRHDLCQFHGAERHPAARANPARGDGLAHARAQDSDARRAWL